MKNKIFPSILLFTIVFIFFGNSISNKYALDDFIVITGNNFTLKGFAGVKEIFSHDSFTGVSLGTSELSGGRYRPLSIASFAVEKNIFGYKPEVFHFFNVLFFALTVVMLFHFFCRLITSDKISAGQFNYTLPFISALLFAILPIHTEVVANIKSRDEIYALLFSIVAFYLLLPKSETKITTKANKNKPSQSPASSKIIRLIGSGIIFFLALLSKENAIPFLLLIPMGLLLLTDDSRGEIIKKTIPLFVVTFVYLLIRANVAGMVGDRVTNNIMNDPFLHATFLQKLATISLVQLRYLILSIFPYQLSYDYSFNQIPLVSFSNILALSSIIIHTAALIFALLNLRKNKIVSYFILFYFATFFIVSNLVFNIGTTMAERFSYMPSVGFCILIAYGLTRLLKVNLTGTPAFKTVPLIVIAIIVCSAAVKTIARNKDWSDNYTLNKADVNKVPESARVRLGYGTECIKLYQKNNDPSLRDEAILQMKKAVEINPAYTSAWLNLGGAYETINDFANSINSYEHVLNQEPSNEQALYRIGYGYGRGLNQPDKAIPYFVKLLSDIKSTKPEYYEALGNCYTMKENLPAAIDYYKQGISVNPASAKLFFNLGMSYGKMGKMDSSDFFFNRAFELDPSLRLQ